jgi:hypothetical protein
LQWRSNDNDGDGDLRWDSSFGVDGLWRRGGGGVDG